MNPNPLNTDYWNILHQRKKKKKKKGLDTIPERTAHSRDAITNSVFILHRNINSALGENIYTVFGHSIFCCT